MASDPAFAADPVGLPVPAAAARCRDEGFVLRVRIADGAGVMGTTDARGDRINVETVGGTITRVIGRG